MQAETEANLSGEADTPFGASQEAVRTGKAEKAGKGGEALGTNQDADRTGEAKKKKAGVPLGLELVGYPQNLRQTDKLQRMGSLQTQGQEMGQA